MLSQFPHPTDIVRHSSVEGYRFANVSLGQAIPCDILECWFCIDQLGAPGGCCLDHHLQQLG